MQYFNTIKNHLADNTGDENVSKLIWIVIAFLVGAALLGILTGVFGNNDNSLIKKWLTKTVENWFPATGETVSKPQ